VIDAAIITVVQKFTSFLQLLGKVHAIWSVEIVFSSEHYCWRESGNLGHGGFTREDINALQSLCTTVSAGLPHKLHVVLDFGICEFDRWSPGLLVERAGRVGPDDVVDAWQQEVQPLQHMLLVFLLQLESCSKGNGTSSASSADGDSVLVDAILFSVIVEFFNDNIGILSLSWVLDKRSISVVDKELNKLSIERRVLETICIIEGIASEVTTSME